MTDNAKKVFAYLKDNAGSMDLTTKMVAEACGVSSPAVTGTFNGLVKKELAYREEVSSEDDKGKVTIVKYLRLNPEAFEYDPEAK